MHVALSGQLQVASHGLDSELYSILAPTLAHIKILEAASPPENRYLTQFPASIDDSLLDPESIMSIHDLGTVPRLAR